MHRTRRPDVRPTRVPHPAVTDRTDELDRLRRDRLVAEAQLRGRIL